MLTNKMSNPDSQSSGSGLNAILNDLESDYLESSEEAFTAETAKEATLPTELGDFRREDDNSDEEYVDPIELARRRSIIADGRRRPPSWTFLDISSDEDEDGVQREEIEMLPNSPLLANRVDNGLTPISMFMRTAGVLADEVLDVQQLLQAKDEELVKEMSQEIRSLKNKLKKKNDTIDKKNDTIDKLRKELEAMKIRARRNLK